MDAKEQFSFLKTRVRYELELRKFSDVDLRDITLKHFLKEGYSPWHFHVLLAMHTYSKYLAELSKRYRREVLGMGETNNVNDSKTVLGFHDPNNVTR